MFIDTVCSILASGKDRHNWESGTIQNVLNQPLSEDWRRPQGPHTLSIDKWHLRSSDLTTWDSWFGSQPRYLEHVGGTMQS